MVKIKSKKKKSLPGANFIKKILIYIEIKNKTFPFFTNAINQVK